MERKYKEYEKDYMAGFEEVLIYSLLFSLVISIIYRLLTNPEVVRRSREEAKTYKEKMNKAKASGDKIQMEKFMGEMMKSQQKQLKQTMKPMIASVLLFFVFIGFLRGTYGDVILNLPFTLPLASYSFPFIIIRDSIGWFWWYILITVPGTMFFRKLLGVE